MQAKGRDEDRPALLLPVKFWSSCRNGQPEAAEEARSPVSRVPATAGRIEREATFTGSVWHGYFLVPC